MSDDDRLIRFPGAKGAPAPSVKKPEPAAPASPEAGQGLDALDEDRRKALSVIMSGMPFVCIGVQPTDTGADFFTSLGGDTAELAKAQPHLDGVIERLFRRRGIL